MRQTQMIFMVLLTIAVGASFVIQRAPKDDRVTELQTQVAMQQETITFLQAQPPPLPSPTDPLTSGVLQPPIPSPTTTVPVQAPANPLPTPNAQAVTSGARVSRVETSLDVAPSGCAVSPQTTFESTDTIYGIATLSDMAAGDNIIVQFMYDTEATLIYEESFTVTEPGSFCRWYTVEPDELGWGAGAYSVSYTVNNNPPVSATYSVQAVPNITQPLDSSGGGDVMEEGQ
jgi:hypothetical protein